MAEEKKEKKSKVTKRSQNNPKAKATKKASTKKAPVKKTTKKETIKPVAKSNSNKVVKKDVATVAVKGVQETNLKAIKEELKKELTKEVIGEIKSETKDAIKEVKEVSKKQVEEINDIKDEIKASQEEVKELVSKEVVPEVKEEVKEPSEEVKEQVAVVDNEVKPNIPTFEYENGHPSSFFDGGVLGYLGWHLLGVLLTVISLGILYPLAEILILKWEYKHTVINGKRLVFDGGYFSLLGHVLLWILLSVITLGIYTFFIPVAWNKWVTKHVHYEGNVGGQSFFTGTTLQIIGVSICSFLISVLSLGLLAPCAYAYAISWRIKHMIIDGDELEFDGKAIGIWGLCFKWLFFTIITLGIYAFWIPISALKWEVKHTNKRGISKKPYNPVLGVLVPLMICLVIDGALAFLFITGKVSYDYFAKYRFVRTEEKENTKKTETKWEDYYYKYLKDELDGDYKGVLIDFNKDNVPELVIKKEVVYCINCDANKEQLNVLYIDNKKVYESKLFDRAHLVNLYNINTKDMTWYIKEKGSTYTKADGIIKNKLDTIDDSEVNNSYVDMEAHINYQKLRSKELKNDLENIEDTYDDKKNYELISDNELDNKLEKLNEEKEDIKTSTLTQDNFKEKIGDHIKWFNAAFLGATYGWPSIYSYKQVDIKLPNGNQDEMVYEVEGLNSIDELKDKLALYVSKDRFNLFAHNDVAYGFTEYNGKVYWSTLGVGDGPYLKDYTLLSSIDGISKVKLNIYNYLTNQLYESVTITVEYQANTKSYLITDWESHLA